MKLLVLIFIINLTQLLGTPIEIRFSQSKYCIGCHEEQGKDWLTSLHSKSHMTKNSLYMSILQYIEDEKFIYKETQALECGQCHNPRMDTKSTGFSYAVSKAFHIEDTESKKVTNSLDNGTSKEGISCIVCHNIEKVHYKNSDLNNTIKSKVKRGFKAITFGPNNVMIGPFKESFRTSFHKMKQGVHFNKEVNTLCFACHYSATNKRNIATYDTGAEYELSNSSKKCVECHMGKYEKKIIAPKVISQIKAIPRNTRRHVFAGARNSNIIKDAIDVSIENRNNYLHIYLKNIIPHKVPTGFAGREIEIEVLYKKHDKTIKKFTKKLNTLYLDKKNNETISYIATKLKHDTRLNVNETREYKIKNINKTTQVQINIWYRLIKESLIPILNIKDEIFLKKYPIYNKTLEL